MIDNLDTDDFRSTIVQTAAGDPAGNLEADRQPTPTEKSVFRKRAETLIHNERMQALLGDALQQHVDDLVSANAEPELNGGRHRIDLNLRRLRMLAGAVRDGFRGYSVGHIVDQGGSILISIVPDQHLDPANPGRIYFPRGTDSNTVELIRLIVAPTNPSTLGRSAERVFESSGYFMLLQHQRARRDAEGRVDFDAGDGVRVFVGNTGECSSYGTLSAGQRVFPSEVNFHHNMPEVVSAVNSLIGTSFYSSDAMLPSTIS